MFVVVNHLYFGQPVPQEALVALRDEALPACRTIPGFVSAQLVRVDEQHHIMVVFGETPEALAAVSGGPGGAWVGRYLRPLLVRDPERHVGRVLDAGVASGGADPG